MTVRPFGLTTWFVLAVGWLSISASPVGAQHRFNEDVSAFRSQIRLLLQNQRFAELDETAIRLRREQPLFQTGRSQLLEFYRCLGGAALNDAPGARQEVIDSLQQLETWHRTRPSTTSRIALADALVESVRLHGAAGVRPLIPADAESESTAALEYASSLLDEIEREVEKFQDPHLHAVRMRLEMQTGTTRERMIELLDRTLACDPRYFAMVDVLCTFVRGHADSDEDALLHLAESLAEKHRPQSGETIYALVAMNAEFFGQIQQFDGSGFDWARARQGFRDWLKPVPDSPYRWGVLAKFAHLARDRSTACEALTILQGRWHTLVFPRRVDYLRTQRWAFDESPLRPGVLIVEIGRKSVTDVVFVENGAAFVPAVSGNQAQIRSAESGKILREVGQNLYGLERLDSDVSGKFVIFSARAGDESRVGILNLSTDEQSMLGSQAGRIRSLLLSQDQRFLAMGNDQGLLRTWENNAAPFPVEWSAGQGPQITAIAGSSDGQTLVSVGGTSAKLWKLATREDVRSWNVRNARVRAVAWSPTEALIATGGQGNEVKLWNADTGNEVATLIGGNTSIQSLAFSGDGKRLVAGTMSESQPQIPGEVVVWNMENRLPMLAYTGHRLGIWKVTVSPDGQKIATASDDGTVRIWPMPKK